MDSIFSPQDDLDTRVNQVFHKDRLDHAHELEEEKKDLAEIYAAKKVADATTVIAGHISKPACRNPHTVLLHLDGFSGAAIDTIMTVCRPSKVPKWHAVRWISSPSRNLESSPSRRPTSTICDDVTKLRTPKIRLRIEVYPGGSWKRLPSLPMDRMASYAIPPNTVLQELLVAKTVTLAKRDRLDLSVKIVRSLLCLIGSPFLQGPWTSERILFSTNSKGLPCGDHINKIYISEEMHGITLTNSNTALSKKAFILDLGVLLWELFFARKVNVIEDDEEIDEEDSTLSLYNALTREESIMRQACVGDNVAWLDIIANCLLAWVDDEMDNEKLRTNLYITIFKPLREYLASYQRPSLTMKKVSTRSPPSPPLLPHLRKRQKLASNIGLPIPEYGISPLSAQGISQMPKISESDHCSTNRLFFTPNPKASAAQSWGKSSHLDTVQSTSSSYWLERFDHANKYLTSLANCNRSSSVRIAVLDTGCDINDPYFSGPGIEHADDLTDRWHDFLDQSTEPVDEDVGGHGTALTCLLLRLAPGATVYVLRVARDSSSLSAAKDVIAKVSRSNYDITFRDSVCLAH